MQGLTPPPHPRGGRATPTGGSAAVLPEGCFAIFRELRNLAKDAHRGRYGTLCPAMPPLRFMGARIAPTPPWKRGTLHPSYFKKGGCVAGLPVANTFSVKRDPI